MQAAINYLNDTASKQRVSLFPMGQGDQAMINSMKLGNTRRNRPVTPHPNFSTVWASPIFAASA
jgi:hypothetical protein